MGKGLEIYIIAELIVYLSAHLIPLALPLAVLLSSIMTMGNLAENNELTALKSSGLSLYKIMKPLMTFMIVLSLVTFYFSNYIIPVANLKMRALIYDIQQTKVALILKPGSFSSELTGFSIKVQKGEDNKFEQVTIYDETNPLFIRVIKADSGELFRSPKGDFLLFKLMNGFMNEELPTPPPTFDPQGNENYKEFKPGRKSTFESATLRIDLSGFQIERSNEDIFKNQFEMMNIFQLQKAVDSSIAQTQSILHTFAKGNLNDHVYYLAKDYKQSVDTRQTDEKTNKKSTKDTLQIVYLDSLNDSQLKVAHNESIAKLRRRLQNLEGQKVLAKNKQEELLKIDAEFHKKFALSVSVLILFFIGAPLGAIVKKGGFGAPVVIAVFLFMIYYIISISGENMLKSEVVSPWLGIWLSSIILTPFAIYLNIRASNDKPLISINLNFIKRWFTKRG
jgi:lipopolysaccharide export system permease protein